MPSPLSNDIALQTQDLNTLLEQASNTGSNDCVSDIVPVFVGSKEAFVQAHIPGSVHLSPQQLVCGLPPAAGKIADEADLGFSFSTAGLNKDSIIIAYDDEGGGWAGRLIWTLDVIGHKHYHFLDGGIIAWQADGLAIEQGDVSPTGSDYDATIDTEQLVSVADITANIAKEDFAIWDARSAPEYRGEKVVAARGGHIPGAVNLDWLLLMDRTNALRLKPLSEIKTMLEKLGIDQSKRIITHCQSHHRSGLSYLTGKLLGLDIKGYDGSWSEWGNLDSTPIEK